MYTRILLRSSESNLFERGTLAGKRPRVQQNYICAQCSVFVGPCIDCQCKTQITCYDSDKVFYSDL
jgi:hypothetical protein